MPTGSGSVTRIDGDAHYVTAARLSARLLGPLESTVADLAEGDRVVVVSLDGGGWVIIGRLPSAT